MKVSILDQAPIATGKTARQALGESLKLAQIGEDLGYFRYWIAEHHDFSGLACSAPEVMLSFIGAQTKKIRLGAGAVLLPHYQPYKIAETYNMLATLFPGRIDIGIGRAPGGSAEASIALSGNYLENVRNVSEKTKDLLHFLHNDFPNDHMFSKVSASPLPEISPKPWILGTSEKSAKLAAENGIAYAFGHFMSDKDGVRIMEHYLKSFKGGEAKPESIVAVSVICAETTEQAEGLALSQLLWKIKSGRGEETEGIPSAEDVKKYSFSSEEEKLMDKLKSKMIIGNPDKVKKELFQIQKQYGVDEIMIVTITHREEDRIQSYRLLSEELSLGLGNKQFRSAP